MSQLSRRAKSKETEEAFVLPIYESSDAGDMGESTRGAGSNGPRLKKSKSGVSSTSNATSGQPTSSSQASWVRDARLDLHNAPRWRVLNPILFLILVSYLAFKLYIKSSVYQYLYIIFSSPEEAQLLYKDQLHSLQHPLDIVMEVAQGNLQHGQVKLGSPGFAEMKEATFRDKYPSQTFGDTFDEIFVITNERCHKQFGQFKTFADQAKIKVTKILAIPGREIDLSNPPLPLKLSDPNLPGVGEMSKVQSAVLRRQIGYTMTHVEIWKRAQEKSRQRILVLDDTLFPKENLIQSLPNLFNWVDQESLAGSQPWHFIFFRRKIMEQDWAAKNESYWEGSEEMWSPNHMHPVVRAKPSYGAGIYAMSINGVNWVLDHFTDYRGPLDMQISMLQREYPREFVALSACNNDAPQMFCPEIVREISITEAQNAYECVWRRMEEIKTASLSYENFNLV